MEWYENGKPKLEGNYSQESQDYRTNLKIVHYWNADNVQKVKDGNGFYEIDNDNESAKGNLKNGNKDGDWSGFNKFQKYTYTERYEHNKLVSGKSIDSNNVEHTYTEPEIKPSPKNGFTDFFKHIQRNFAPLPHIKVGGKIFLRFSIDVDGKIIDPVIIKGIHPELDNEVVRVITSYEHWNPGISRGVPVKTFYSLPISLPEAR